jgi:hypothetical protein
MSPFFFLYYQLKLERKSNEMKQKTSRGFCYQNVSPTTDYGNDHFCEVWLKSRQQFDLHKPERNFLFKALVAILCSGAAIFEPI